MRIDKATKHPSTLAVGGKIGTDGLSEYYLRKPQRNKLVAKIVAAGLGADEL